jgi:4-amino-4-deoxy-L-arabinose transferase-like glycosyltransferase
MNVPALSESETTTITPDVSQRKWSFVAAGLLALIYFVTSILIARHRLFWYDEIYTVVLSRLPDLGSIWRVLAHGGDSMPPTYYMLVRAFERLPIPFEVSARLPSALAMVIGMLITFDCARRLTDGLHGLIALAVLSCSILPYYGYEARPYTLYFMFASMALWLRLHASDTGKLSALLFGIVIFLGVAVHYYVVLCLVPYAAWEAWNWRRRRAPSSRLVAGLVAVLCAGALFSTQILSIHRVLSPASWSPATVASLAAIYDDFFPYALFPLIGIMILVGLAGPGKKDAAIDTMQPSEQLCWFFAFIPLAGYVLAKIGANAFYNRYFIGLLPGIAVAFSCLLWRQLKSSRWISVGALILFAVLGLGRQLDLVRHPAHVRPLARKTEPDRMNEVLSLQDKIPATQSIVIPSGEILSLEAHYYAKHPERYVFLLGPHESRPDLWALGSSGENRPIRHWTVEELIAHAREATLINPSQDTIDTLEHAGHKTSGHYDGVLDVVNVE